MGEMNWKDESVIGEVVNNLLRGANLTVRYRERGEELPKRINRYFEEGKELQNGLNYWDFCSECHKSQYKAKEYIQNLDFDRLIEEISDDELEKLRVACHTLASYFLARMRQKDIDFVSKFVW